MENECIQNERLHKKQPHERLKALAVRRGELVTTCHQCKGVPYDPRRVHKSDY